VTVLAALLALAACHHNPPPPPAPVGPSAEELARARQDSVARANRIRQDSIDAANAARDRAAQAERDRLASSQRTMRQSLEAAVHFDYDEADIKPEAERILRDKVDILRANPDVKLRIEGNADERGSTEYNLALGSRRAQTVKEFFTGFGLDASRFETTSYGEEKPLNPGHDEEAWAQNRRDEFVITGGGDNLRPPR
jgi:peptidoglycan-associated lipoprotein